MTVVDDDEKETKSLYEGYDGFNNNLGKNPIDENSTLV